MTLREMAKEYRGSGREFHARIAELKQKCGNEAMSETERILLRRRICVLETIERELRSTGKYLENYYGR